MDKTLNKKRISLVFGIVLFILLCTAIGSIMGIGWSSMPIRENGYLSSGFYKTAFLILQKHTTEKVLIGLFVAIFCLAFIFIRRSIISRWKNELFCQGIRPYLICTLSVIYILVGHSLVYGVNGKVGTIGVVALGGIWCILFNYYKRRGFSGSQSWLGNNSFICDINNVTAAVVFIMPFLDKKHVYYILRHQEILLAVIIAVLLILLVIIFSVIPSYTAKKSTKTTKIITAILFFFFVILTILPAICFVCDDYVLSKGMHPDKPVNIVLIGIDTLRHDHVSLLNTVTEKNRDLTPNLRKMAQSGTVFTSAISQAPWTMPAFASILTGKYPHEHGAISLRGALGKEQMTIAEILRESGYYTAAVVSHSFVDSRRNFDQGFEYFNEDYVLGHWDITSDRITDVALEVIEEHKDKPFFLFLHYFDPHYEYRDHKEWTFSDSYSGWLLNEPDDIKNLRIKRHMMKSEDIEYLTDLYDEEIAYTDKQIGRLIDYFEKEGLIDNTIFVVVADHGEEFMERGWLGHAISLYDELIKVPMFIVLPKSEQSAEVKQTVETRAVFSAILDYVGLPYQLESKPLSLLDILSMKNNARSDNSMHLAYSSVWLPDAPADSGKRVRISAVRNDCWKFIIDHSREKEMLFDIVTDPDEKKNIILQKIEVADDLRKHLQEWLDNMLNKKPEIIKIKLNQDEIDRLKSLGYL